jgi:hypothetical protein
MNSKNRETNPYLWRAYRIRLTAEFNRLFQLTRLGVIKNKLNFSRFNNKVIYAI